MEVLSRLNGSKTKPEKASDKQVEATRVEVQGI